MVQDLLDRLALQDRCNDSQFSNTVCGKWVKSKLNTRFNSLAQPMHIGRPCSGGSWSLVAAAGNALVPFGDITWCVVPSRHGVFSLSSTCPFALILTRSLANAEPGLKQS